MKEKKTCHLCNEEFYPSHTNYHYKKQHPDFDFIDYKKEQQKLKLKNHKCKYCGCSIKNGECCSSDNCKEQKKKEKEKGNAIKNKKRKCHLCGEEISNYNPLLHYKEKHPDFDYESYKEERKQSKKKNYKCRYCGCSIKSGVCCLKKSCAKRKLNDDNIIKNNIKFDGKIENYDFISCPICGYKSTQLTNHYKNVHNLSYEEYHNLYPNLICCQKYRETNSERFSKEKNPAYQHGGRLSSNSIKFDKYINGEADYTIEDVRAKKRQTLKENPQRRKTRFEYWIERGYSQEEAREKVRERQTTFSKEKCIEKYGEEEGIKRWNDRQEKWLRTMDSKTQEEKDREIIIHIINGGDYTIPLVDLFGPKLSIKTNRTIAETNLAMIERVDYESIMCWLENNDVITNFDSVKEYILNYIPVNIYSVDKVEEIDGNFKRIIKTEYRYMADDEVIIFSNKLLTKDKICIRFTLYKTVSQGNWYKIK